MAYLTVRTCCGPRPGVCEPRGQPVRMDNAIVIAAAIGNVLLKCVMTPSRSANPYRLRSISRTARTSKVEPAGATRHQCVCEWGCATYDRRRLPGLCSLGEALEQLRLRAESLHQQLGKAGHLVEMLLQPQVCRNLRPGCWSGSGLVG